MSRIVAVLLLALIIAIAVAFFLLTDEAEGPAETGKASSALLCACVSSA